MKVGKLQREILAVLQDGGELYNDAGMWTVALKDEDGHWSARVQADPCQRLFARGFIMCVRVKEKCGRFGEDRAVFLLTEKGKGV